MYREHLGVPDNWNMIRGWISNPDRLVQADCPSKPSFSVKCPEIDELKRYDIPPANAFWNKFPKNLDKKTCSTPIKIEKFIDLVNSNSKTWSYQQKNSANKAIKTLKFGSKLCFKTGLKKSFFSQNGKSAFKHGKLFTDTIAIWVKKRICNWAFFTPSLQKHQH